MASWVSWSWSEIGLLYVHTVNWVWKREAIHTLVSIYNVWSWREYVDTICHFSAPNPTQYAHYKKNKKRGEIKGGNTARKGT